LTVLDAEPTLIPGGYHMTKQELETATNIDLWAAKTPDVDTDKMEERKRFWRSYMRQSRYWLKKNDVARAAGFFSVAQRAFSAECNCGASHDHGGSGYCGY
jgi:hypothetical protein